MKVRLSLLTIAAVFTVLGALAVLPGVNATAHGEEETSSEQVSAEESTEGVSENPQEASYNYHAQPGDSYSKMARKAVQTYGLTNSIDLSGAKIVYAETHLTQEAGSPSLNEGQDVYINESSVKSWVERAMAITAEEEAAWDYYVQFVDFNTDNVGESRS